MVVDQIDIRIQERSEEGWRIVVDLNRGGDMYTYKIELDEEFKVQLGGDEEPERLIRRTFSFLLSREGPEQILTEFNLRDVNRYFPDFDDAMQNYGG